MNKLKKQLLRWFQLVSVFLLIGIFLTVGKTALAQNKVVNQSVDKVFNSKVNIDQSTLLNGSYTLRQVLESGGDFFSQPYTPEDGVGEGDNGPRSWQRKAYYPHANINFLKFNGLGAQSCFECHHSIGTYNEPGTENLAAILRKPGATGGSSGFASNAYINPNFPNHLTELIRNPPHVFGTGYTQELATELTYELQMLRDQAHAEGQKSPNTTIQKELNTSKGVNFGTLQTTCTSSSESDCSDDFSAVEGVAEDLVIRPFQWKGISSSVRHFARDAMDFHFSMQAEEKVGYNDCDKDGIPASPSDKTNEVTVGNLSALTAFVAMTRPPVQQWPQDYDTLAKAQQGQILFEQNCATCHIPKLTIYEPSVLISSPPDPSTITTCPTETASLVNPQSPNGEDLEVIQHYKAVKDKLLQLASATNSDSELMPALGVEEAIEAVMDEQNHQQVPSDLGYLIDLTPTAEDNLPAYVYPRLPVTNNNNDVDIDVPLYSDLKTHDMGMGLSDIVSQGSDVSGISIHKRQFLTRPLWGVADTGPWLHDGRARSLEEAILMHADLTNPDDGSAAITAVEAFTGFQQDQRDALVQFLLTLHLPIQQNLEIDNAPSDTASSSSSSSNS